MLNDTNTFLEKKKLTFSNPVTIAMPASGTRTVAHFEAHWKKYLQTLELQMQPLTRRGLNGKQIGVCQWKKWKYLF